MTARFAARVLACAVAVFACASPSGSARADAAAEHGATTVLVIAAPDDPFGLRLVAELETLGLRVVVDEPSDEPASRASLEAAARAGHAIAAIRAVPSERGVEVWIADRVTGKTVLREVKSDGGTADRNSLALRAVELLRASLLEVTLPAPPAGEVPPPPDLATKLKLPSSPAFAEPPAPTVRASVAAGALTSPGGFGSLAAFALGVDWTPGEYVGVLGLAALPLGHATVERATGSADFSALLAGGAVRVRMTKRASPWAPSVDLGVTALRFQSSGTASTRLVKRSVSAWAAAPFARFGLAYALTSRFRLRADVLGGVVPHGVSIRFADAEVATWGSPFVLSSLGADFGWF